MLLVEPNSKDRAVLIDILRESEYTVFAADTEEKAFKIARENPIDVFLVEADIPNTPFCSICDVIKKENFEYPFQIVVISSKTDAEKTAYAFSSGADDFIKKPIDRYEVQARIKAAEIRLQRQVGLLREREFYRNAVREEEALSSKILNQNISLKRAYQDMIDVNKELERTNQELEKIAKYDYLSGLLNRMNLFAIMDMEIDRAVRTHTTLSGIMMDIDNFKAINDNYGHQVGDEVIKNIGKCLIRELRKYDHAGRYGGEEFFIVLPNTEVNQAFMIGERIRENFENNPIYHDSLTLHITASMGIAEFREGETKEKWINRADRAMYMAKETGRNKVIAE